MIAQFALRLLFGMGLTWAVLPRGKITSGFFRIQLLLALGLCVLAAVTVEDVVFRPASPYGGEPAAPSVILPQGASVALCVSLAVCSFFGSVFWTLERRRAGTVLLFLIAAGAAAWLLASARAPSDASFGARAQRSASEAAAGAVLGSCVTGMLLGHWYLTSPTMSIAPLGRANAWFAGTVLARAALCAWGLSMTGAASLAGTHAVWLVLRWTAGLLLPLVLCAMVARILRYRNTQAATGVLFAGVILVFLGELAGTLLSREVGTPL